MKNQKPKAKNHKMTAIKVVFLLTFELFFFCSLTYSQQLPYYTQFKPNNIMLNPGVIGTKRIIDARMNYRTQWVGFDDSPVTKGFSLNTRFLKGVMGAGVSYYTDITGPSKRNNLSFGYTFHAKFDDVELSLGASANRITYAVDGTKLHMHIPADNVIDLTLTQTKKVWDMSAGALFYNDRFHLGLSILNLVEPSINFYPEEDTVHKTNLRLVPHIYSSVGYNWSGQPDWIWDNSLQVLYAEASPMTIDYCLRLHYKQKIFGGASIRLRDAIALHVGATFLEDFNVSYSYDIVTSPLKSYESGSHEVMLIWSSNIGMDKKKKYENNRFKKQRYGYMF